MNILISYSCRDVKYARFLKKHIKRTIDENSIAVWLDEHDLPFGSEIRSHLKTKIYESDLVILIASTSSINSKWVKFEINTTLNFEKKIKRAVLLPLKIENIELPKKITGRVWIDCTTYILQEKNLRKLIRQLATTTSPFQSQKGYQFRPDYSKIMNTIITSPQQITIKSPMIGVFYASSEPDKPPFVNVGDRIKVGTVICCIEAMKLFNTIESDCEGIILKILAKDGPIEYDQPMFLIEVLN